MLPLYEAHRAFVLSSRVLHADEREPAKSVKRVKANKGAAGVDGLDIEQTAHGLQTSWPRIRQQLTAGKYRPSLVRRVMVPKADGSQRELGIPTVVDRLIQHALLQVLQPQIDPSFSNHSHGFRPGRRAHDAVKAARAYVQSGKRVVVDVDLAKFFDRINHDILIERLQKRIDDAGVIGLIRAYLNAGIMDGGVVMARQKGTPQGGPLSPLLANVLLDEVDKALVFRFIKPLTFKSFGSRSSSTGNAPDERSEHHTDHSLAGIVLVEPAQQCSPLSTNAARPVCRAMPDSARMCWSSKIAERSVYVKLLMERSTRLQKTQPCAWERLSVLSRLR